MSYRIVLSVRRTPSGDYAAVLRAPMMDGRTLVVRSVASYEAAREAVRGYREEMGLSLRDLIRQAKKTAQKIAKSKAVKLLGRIAKSPMFQSLLPPQLTMALNGIQAAAKAIKAARRGSREAMRAIQAAASRGPARAALDIAKAALGPAQVATCRCGA